MRYWLILLLIFSTSCDDKFDNSEREMVILERLVKNAFTKDWLANKNNRNKIVKWDSKEKVSPEKFLWRACDTDICEKLMYHLKTLEVMELFSDEKWQVRKETIRENCLKELKSKVYKERYDAVTKLMIFGKLQDVKNIAPLLLDSSYSVRRQATGTLIQLGAPYRIELIGSKNMKNEELKNHVDYYLKWLEDNKGTDRETLLWNQLQETLPSHHKQTVINGLISLHSAYPNKKHFGSKITWKLIKEAFDDDVKYQAIVLLGVLADPEYIDHIIEKKLLSTGSIGRRERVSWALNRMGYPNPQPFK